MRKISLRSCVSMLLVLCMLFGMATTAMAAKPETADAAVKEAREYCSKAKELVDLIVSIAIEGEYASMFKGSETSKSIKKLAIDIIEDELVKTENRSLVESFGFDPDKDANALANEVYQVACIYYDAFSVQCDTVNNGCVGLPITWTAVDVMPGQEIESEFVYTVFLNDEPVFTSEPTAEQSFSYTPTEGGAYSATVQMSNELTEDSRTCEAVPVAEQLIMGHYEQDDDPTATEPIAWKILTVEDGKAFVVSQDILDKGSYFNPEWIKYKYTYWNNSCIVAIRDFNYWGSMPEDPSRLMTGLTEDSVPLEWFGERGPETDLFYLHARFWCNDTFYNGAFSDEEKERILLTTNVNHENHVYGIDGGPDSEDYVFFLSHDELDAYLPTNEDRMANYSTYAENIPLEYGTPGLYYWLRTPGRGRYNAMYVHGGAGVADTYGCDVGHNNVGYRPAMWITVGG